MQRRSNKCLPVQCKVASDASSPERHYIPAETAIRMGWDPRHFGTDRDQQNKAKPSAANRHAAQAPALDQAQGARKARRYADAVSVGLEGVEPRLQGEQIWGHIYNSRRRSNKCLPVQGKLASGRPR